MKSVETFVTNNLLLATNLGVLLLESSLTSNLSCLDSFSFSCTLSLGVGVEFLHKSSVLQWVLVGGVTGNSRCSNTAEFALYLVRVDNSGKISDGHLASVKLISSLLNTVLSVSSEDVVEVSESILGEDNESSKMTTWGELEQVKSVNAASVNTWEVSGSSLQEGVLISVNNEWTFSQNEARVSHLVLTSTGSLSGADSVEITFSTNFVKSGKESACLFEIEVVNNEGKFWNTVDVVTSGENEWGNS